MWFSFIRCISLLVKNKTYKCADHEWRGRKRWEITTDRNYVFSLNTSGAGRDAVDRGHPSIRWTPPAKPMTFVMIDMVRHVSVIGCSWRNWRAKSIRIHEKGDMLSSSINTCSCRRRWSARGIDVGGAGAGGHGSNVKEGPTLTGPSFGLKKLF